MLNQLTEAASRSLSQRGISGAIRGLLGTLTGRPLSVDADVASTVETTANLIGQLAPQLFEGQQQTPEQAGGVLIPTEPPTRRINPQQPESWRGMRLNGDGTVTINTAGFRGRYNQDDYEITGEMMPVTSSCVHSIGFQMNMENPARSLLLVRYLQGPKDSKTMGPLYGYKNVHPKLLRQFVVANRKGIFVWDELRIRGSVAGHQYAYTLMGVVGGNIPRRARIFNNVQYLIRRTKTEDATGKTVHSHLQSKRIGPYRPTSNRPNTGNPNRNTPNRGR